MEAFETILNVVNGPVATITLNRPETRNALSGQMVDELLRCFELLRDDPAHAEVRVVVLRALGPVFCSGGDLRNDMRPNRGSAPGSAASAAAASVDGGADGHTGAARTAEEETEQSERRAALARLDTLLRAIQTAPQVVVARIQGAAMGGGVGLVAAVDIGVAGYSAVFGLPEVRLGLVPALVAPYVIQRVGLACARHLMLTGTRFGGEAAMRMGLVNEHAPDNELDARVEAVVTDVLRAGPQALRACKALLAELAPIPDTLATRVDVLERLRGGSEAAEGIAAFLQRRSAPWMPSE